jgi:hypothetical protein
MKHAVHRDADGDVALSCACAAEQVGHLMRKPYFHCTSPFVPESSGASPQLRLCIFALSTSKENTHRSGDARTKAVRR